MLLLSASSGLRLFNRRGTTVACPPPLGGVAANSGNEICDVCAMDSGPKNTRPKTKNPPAVFPAVGQLRSCSKRLLTKLAFHSYKTQRPSPSFADDNNRQRSLE